MSDSTVISADALRSGQISRVETLESKNDAGLNLNSQRAERSSVDPIHIETLSPEEIVREVKAAVELLNETVAREDVKLNFRIDEVLNKPIVTVISEETGEVVQQLPNEKILHAARQIETMKGVLFDQRT